MAEFVTKAENKRRLAIIIVCAVVNVAALTFGGIGMKKGGDIEHGAENSGNLIKLRQAVEAQKDREKAAEQTSLKATEATNAEKMKQIDGGAAPNAPATGLIGDVIRNNQDLNKTQKSNTEELQKIEEEAIAKQNESTTVKN